MAEALKDRTLYCARCGITFLWSKEEQSQANSKENETPLTTPTHCQGCRFLLPKPDRQRGVIKWFNGRKRFGFVTPYEGKDIFVHGSEVRKKSRLKPGDLVEFSLKDSDRGKIAADVVLLPFRVLDSEDV